MDLVLVFMGVVDVVAGVMLLGTGELGSLVAYVLLFKGGLSLLSTPW